jgi:hypothetical protein
MDFSTLLTSLQDNSGDFSSYDVVLTIVLSFVLSLVIGYTYRSTHRGVAYSQSYVQTVVLMSMVVGVIMLVIGSNIARAFTLVGALSIVRFRNAVKETRDVGYIFFAMGIGMACGTRFYLLAIIATVVICALLGAMDHFNFFAKDASSQLLKIRLPADLPYVALFDGLFARYLIRYELVALETVQAGTMLELVYSVEAKRGIDVQSFLNELAALNDNNKVVLVTGQQEVDL